MTVPSKINRQDLTVPSRVSFGVAKIDRQPHTPAQVFGSRTSELIGDLGWTIPQFAKAMEISPSTAERLLRGEMTLKNARKTRVVLAKAKADVSKLPTLDASTAVAEDSPEWLDEWIRIGLLLEEHSKPEWWTTKFAELKARADALDVQARELEEMSRPK